MSPRLKLSIGAFVVLVAVIGAGWAMMPAPDDPAECDSCTARHNSLQRLQQARTSQTELLLPEAAASQESDAKDQ
jgi:hypothetical protein